MREPFVAPAIEFTARLPADLNERLRAVAQAQRTSKNAALVAAVADFLREADTAEEGSA